MRYESALFESLDPGSACYNPINLFALSLSSSKLFYNAPLHLAQFLPKANEVLALRRIGFTLGLEKEG